MGAKGPGEWKKLIREMKILRARKKTGGLLPRDEDRLRWLEERLGETREVERIQIDEQDDGGPRTLTSDDHYATEVSEDLIEKAGKFKAKKAWDKDVQRGPRTKFEAADSREGRATFQQKGLSPFAIDLTEDFRDAGLADEPVEEEEGIEKEQQWARANVVSTDELDSAGQDSGGANPFAISVDAGLAGALGKFEDDSEVPDSAARSFEADEEPTLPQEPFPEAPAEQPRKSSRPLPSLNLEAARVGTPPPDRPAPRPVDLEHSKELLSSLFCESEQPASPRPEPAPTEPIIIGPAKKARPKASQARQAAVGRGVSRQPAMAKNDLRGPRRATVHFRDGVNRRGTINNIDTDSDTVRLDPVPGSGAAAEMLTALALKAIFLLLPRGLAHPEKQGHHCKVMMVDNRTLEGYTPDYDPARKAFTLFPSQDRGNIERIIIYNDAVKNMWFPEE